MKQLLAAGLVLAFQGSDAQQTVPACHLKAGFAIGCIGDVGIGDVHAADMFSGYRFDKPKIMADYTRSYINSFLCIRMTDKSGVLKIEKITTNKIATSDGWVTVEYVAIKANSEPDRLVWVAEPYLSGTCKRWTMVETHD